MGCFSRAKSGVALHFPPWSKTRKVGNAFVGGGALRTGTVRAPVKPGHQVRRLSINAAVPRTAMMRVRLMPMRAQAVPQSR